MGYAKVPGRDSYSCVMYQEDPKTRCSSFSETEPFNFVCDIVHIQHQHHQLVAAFHGSIQKPRRIEYASDPPCKKPIYISSRVVNAYTFSIAFEVGSYTSLRNRYHLGTRCSGRNRFLRHFEWIYVSNQTRCSYFVTALSLVDVVVIKGHQNSAPVHVKYKVHKQISWKISNS